MPNSTHPNPICVDDRTGSDRLYRPLLARRQPVSLCRIPFGDVSFLGNGPDSRPIPIGIEYKLIGDALKCITDGRFAGHQLIGLNQSYEVVILLIEGIARPSARDGLLQIQHPVKRYWWDAKVGPRKFMYRDFSHWLTTLTMKAGVHIVRTADLDESVQQIVDLYQWWNGKEWEQHRSHLVMHNDLDDRVKLYKPTLVRTVAACLPGVGAEKSAAVNREFTSVWEMALADEKRWTKVPGIGKTMAERIVRAILGEKQ